MSKEGRTGPLFLFFWGDGCRPCAPFEWRHVRRATEEAQPANRKNTAILPIGELEMSWRSFEMPRKRLSVLAAALVLAGTFAAPALAQRDGDGDRSRWVLLGERKVDMAAERDVIKIGRGEDWWKERGFRRLHLVAERSDIRLMALRLVYQNGHQEDVKVDRTIRAGEDQRVELRGERKYLERIEFLYRARPSFDPAIMKVYGVPARSGGPVLPPIEDGPGSSVGNWVDLGCRQVEMDRVDRDAIRVGQRDGRFKAIRLLGRGADIQILDLWVVYGNGETDQLQVRSLLRQGDTTRPLDLQGWQRVIDRIELTYVRIPNFKGQATVCAEGLQ